MPGAWAFLTLMFDSLAPIWGTLIAHRVAFPMQRASRREAGPSAKTFLPSH